MKTKAMILFAALLLTGSAARAQAQCLTLEVRDIDRVQGFLYVAVYSSPDNFLKKLLTGFRVEVKDKTVIVPCEGLPKGTYALALFQDLNGNGTLDTGAFGIPQEPTGFSNDAQGVMGPPSFEECSFTLRGDTTLVVHLRRLAGSISFSPKFGLQETILWSHRDLPMVRIGCPIGPSRTAQWSGMDQGLEFAGPIILLTINVL